jgi:hypothetical protein
VITFAIGPNLYVADKPATWIDSATGQPIGDGRRGACYWKLDVVKVPDQATKAVAKAIRLGEHTSQEGSHAEHDQNDRRDR